MHSNFKTPIYEDDKQMICLPSYEKYIHGFNPCSLYCHLLLLTSKFMKYHSDVLQHSIGLEK